MSNRLLSFLSEIERALIANNPSPDDGHWDTLRLINFQQGLARLTLSVRSSSGLVSPRGAILLQSFALADGSLCMKASLTWQGTDNSVMYAIYAKPKIDWRLEASQIADKWLDGLLAVTEVHNLHETHGETSMATATG